MTDFSIASIATTVSVQEADDQSYKTIVLFCGIGLLASFCLITLGVNFGAGWM